MIFNKNGYALPSATTYQYKGVYTITRIDMFLALRYLMTSTIQTFISNFSCRHFVVLSFMNFAGFLFPREKRLFESFCVGGLQQ